MPERGIDHITMARVLDGTLKPEDIRISREALVRQAEVARSNGLVDLAENLERGAELVEVPDSEALEIYEVLRPGRASRTDILRAADRLETAYGAGKVARMLREAVGVYELRGLLR